MNTAHCTPLNEPDTSEQCKTPFEKMKGEEDNGMACCLLLPAAIAAVIIGSHYDESTSPCGEGGDGSYTIDLQLFLYIGGYIQIGFLAYRLVLTCCSYLCSGKERKQCKECANCPQCLIAIFNLVWAGNGLYIYTREMKKQCRAESIGVMVLSW
eukprot:UN10597